MTASDENMTPEQFDAAFEAGTRVEIVGKARVSVEHDSPMPTAYFAGVAPTFGSVLLPAPGFGRSYPALVSPQVEYATSVAQG